MIDYSLITLMFYFFQNMAPTLEISKIKLVSQRTLSINQQSTKSASAALREILWGIGDVKTLSEEDQDQEAVILTAEYEDEEAAEDAMAELLAFTPEATKNPRPTPWSDKIRSKTNFELIGVQRDTKARRTLSLQCRHADQVDLLLAAENFGDVQPPCQLVQEGPSVHLTVIYSRVLSSRRAYAYWRRYASREYRPTSLLEDQLAPPVAAHKLKEPKTPQDDEEEDLDHRKLHILIPRGLRMKQLKEEFNTFRTATLTELTMYDGNHHGFVLYSNEEEARAALNVGYTKNATTRRLR